MNRESMYHIRLKESFARLAGIEPTDEDLMEIESREDLSRQQQIDEETRQQQIEDEWTDETD